MNEEKRTTIHEALGYGKPGQRVIATHETPTCLAPVPGAKWADEEDGGDLWAVFGLPATHPLYHAVFMSQHDAEQAVALLGSPQAYTLQTPLGQAEAQVDL